MKASDWIDKIKTARHWDSDYRVAKELGVGPATVSNYRVRGGTLDEVMSIKVAGVLGERPEAVLLDQYAERTKNPVVRTALLNAARDLCVYYVKYLNAIDPIAAYARNDTVTPQFG